MPAVFSRSLHDIAADGHRVTVAGIAVGGLLLAGWLSWFVFARVARHEASDAARVEVGQAAHRVEAPIDGKVAAVYLTLGAEVRAGDVLVELDMEPLVLAREEKRAQLAATSAQLAPLRAQAQARRRVLGDAHDAARARLQEAHARVLEARALARYQELEAARAVKLRADGLISDAEVVRLEADALAKRRSAEALARAETRTGAEQRGQEGDIMADLARLDRDAAALEGEKATLQAAVDTLSADIERGKLRAPIAGRVGEITVLRVGSFVAQGAMVAAVVPPGDLKVIAEFPAVAIGRLRVGQAARVRLDAFPWTEYGTLPAAVERIATEAPKGRIRVELGVDRDANPAIPMQHGLSGSVVVEVERVSPAVLVLRAAGQLLRVGRAEGSG